MWQQRSERQRPGTWLTLDDRYTVEVAGLLVDQVRLRRVVNTEKALKDVFGTALLRVVRSAD